MTIASAPPRSDGDVLRACLEEIASAAFGGRRGSILGIERQRSAFSSFYASDVITLRLVGGEEARVFLKDFGSYDHPKDALDERRERELAVYRDVLAGAELGTPRYYGSEWDGSAGRHWLFLEYVEGEPVKHHDFEYWVPPAAWLGRMQGYFASHPELWATCPRLVRHDAAFYHSTAERALRSVAHFSHDYVRRLEPVVHGYDAAVRVMTAQSKTFVHGTYRPAQIIVDETCRPARFCPVDWEKAAVGSGLYDLTFLADGFKPPRLGRMLDAYRDAAASHGAAVCGIDEMVHVMNCIRLHRVMNWLSLAHERNFPEREVVKLLDRADEIGRLGL